MNRSEILAVIIAYLLGSIPFGFLIVKIASGADIRETGSGGTGATNVTRKAGKGAGIVTLIFDALKGVAAVTVARMLTDEEGTTWVVAGAGVLAVVGHCFPVWLKFKAGKGVATGLGVFVAIVPWAVLGAFAALLVSVIGCRRVGVPLLAWLDCVAPAFALGAICERIGALLATIRRRMETWVTRKAQGGIRSLRLTQA